MAYSFGEREPTFILRPDVKIGHRLIYSTVLAVENLLYLLIIQLGKYTVDKRSEAC